MTDNDWMQLALAQARFAEAEGEVPVGAVLVKEDQLIASSYNQPIQQHDATAHAEVMVIRQAGQVLNNYRLSNTELYITLEPCLMCVGAIIHARIQRVVFAASDPKLGCLSQQQALLAMAQGFNHQFQVRSGILAQESQQLLTTFFRQRR